MVLDGTDYLSLLKIKIMLERSFHFSYKVYTSIDELNERDAALVQKARAGTAIAYAPYSKFLVSCIARLKDGTEVLGTNQENASYPVGICAERALLSILGNLYPNESIDLMVISYNNHNDAKEPISPCGMCRQALSEYEQRIQSPIRILLSGQTGEIFEISSAKDLLPLAFKSDNL